MRVLVWALRALVFFALFALALNNQQAVTVHGVFGLEWSTRMIYVVLAAFVGGCAIGVLAMTPRWWRRRRQTAPPAPSGAQTTAAAAPTVARSDAATSALGAEAALPARVDGW